MKFHEIDLDGDRCYSLVIDFEIPDDKTIDTDELYLSITQEEITVDRLSHFTNQLIKSSGCKFTKQKSLIASRKAQRGYLISLNLLRLYESLSLKCIKFHRVFSFKQEAILKDFLSTNISLRKAAETKFNVQFIIR